VDGLKKIIRKLVYEKLEQELSEYLKEFSVLEAVGRLKEEEAKKPVSIETSLLTEEAVRKLILEGERTIRLTGRCLITPLAADLIREADIRVIRTEEADVHR